VGIKSEILLLHFGGAGFSPWGLVLQGRTPAG
jgi:hypothetical protein